MLFNSSSPSWSLNIKCKTQLKDGTLTVAVESTRGIAIPYYISQLLKLTYAC